MIGYFMVVVDVSISKKVNIQEIKSPSVDREFICPIIIQ